MMTWETQFLFAGLDKRFLVFVFFATMFTYYFHSLVNTNYQPESRRHEWNNRNKHLITALFLVSGIITVISWWPYKQHYWPLLGAGLATFLYSAPNLPYKPFVWIRKIAIGKTIYLALVWTYVTTLLPILSSGIPVSYDAGVFALSRFFLIYAICILFDKRDQDEDKAKGVRTLATLTHERTLKVIYFESILLSMVFAIWHGSNTTALSASFILAPAVILLFLYPGPNTRNSEMHYFFVLDGLMMLSALLRAIYIYLF